MFNMIEHYEIAGLLGVGFAIYAYARVQLQRDYAKQIEYSVLNLANAALLMYSLCFNWNLASFIGNAIWAAISLYGVYRCLKYKSREAREPQAASNP